MSKKQNLRSTLPGDSSARRTLSRQEFEEAFDMYYSAVRNFLYYKTSRAEMSEDVAQDAFVKLWETRDNIDRKSLRSYLFTIANNMVINKLKREQLKFKFLNLQETGREIKDPQYLLEMSEFDEKLQRILAKIPDGPREVFLMNRIDGYKYHEIADMLSLSMKAIEKRMSKALAIIRKEMDYKI